MTPLLCRLLLHGVLLNCATTTWRLLLGLFLTPSTFTPLRNHSDKYYNQNKGLIECATRLITQKQYLNISRVGTDNVFEWNTPSVLGLLLLTLDVVQKYNAPWQSDLLEFQLLDLIGIFTLDPLVESFSYRSFFIRFPYRITKCLSSWTSQKSCFSKIEFSRSPWSAGESQGCLLDTSFGKKRFSGGFWRWNCGKHLKVLRA